MLEKMLPDVARFNADILKVDSPVAPRFLDGERFDKRFHHLGEELNELQDATTKEDQVDALIDLVYVALGAVLEMGYLPGPAFDEVHAANMKKVPGVNKRGWINESAKPEGWRPPDFVKWADITRADLDRLAAERAKPEMYSPRASFENGPAPTFSVRSNPFSICKPNLKVLLLGHGRHGKDTVAETLRDEYGLSFTSSSMFCAERVMMPHFDRLGHPHYANAEQCYEDRGNRRAEWFRAIDAYNTPDKSSLGRAIFSEHDVYCGLRSKREWAAIKNAGLYDVCVWVDASDRVGPEPRDSCTVEPWMADYVVDNNGTLDDLRFNVRQLMDELR